MHFVFPKIILRPFQMQDAALMYSLNLDPDVQAFTGDLPFESVASAERFIEQYDHYQRYGYGRWTLIDRWSHQKYGWCGLRWDDQSQRVDLGYRILPEYRGRGWATLAAAASVKLGFEKFKIRKIYGRTASENVASIKVLEKCGFVFLKKEECHGIPDARVYVRQKT